MAQELSARSLARLRECAGRFDEAGRAAQAHTLRALAAFRLRADAALCAYHALLLFLRAHPGDAGLLRQVESELARIGRFVKSLPTAARARLENEGLPFADTVTRFSHDGVRQLRAHPGVRVRLDHAGEPTLDLNAVLRLTLPAPEWSHTTAGLADDELLRTLGVAENDKLRFLVDELARLEDTPFVKDHLFDSLDLFVRVSPRGAAFSKANNRLGMPALFFQQDRIKRFDTLALMNRRLPRPRHLDAAAAAEVVRVIRDTLTLTCRETDPGTYLDERSLRVFDLERGISVALYGMTPERQLPYESYLGFMLFKNGMAAAYGGAWAFGARADFGMNIFEPYRGGESGFMMCQVLRVYRQTCGIRHFEVDAHQFGLDNPDGIASGAFWFYHRHGFRPVNAALARLAQRESRRLAATPGARSSEKTLLAFTGSSVALDFGGGALPPTLAQLTHRITRWLRIHGAGHRADGERIAIDAFVARTGAPRPRAAARQRVLVEVALLAAALGIDDEARLRLLQRMVLVKPNDPYRYQHLLLALLDA